MPRLGGAFFTAKLKNMSIPQHIAIIMDGNGRWAKSRNLPRFRGHLEGIKSVERIMAEAVNLGIKVLTLFAFSAENWNRPKHEVFMLMKAFSSTLEKQMSNLMSNNIRMQFIGRRENIPGAVLKTIKSVETQTKDNIGLRLIIAFNYGSRQEIVDAAKKISADVKSGKLVVENIDEDIISQALYTKDIPDPDFLIRTSGEKRISNFLLWQLSYAELYFTETHWPDFDEQELGKAIADFKHRERRYGKVSASKR